MEERGKKRKLLAIKEYKPMDAVEMLSRKITILQALIDIGGNHLWLLKLISKKFLGNRIFTQFSNIMPQITYSL